MMNPRRQQKLSRAQARRRVEACDRLPGLEGWRIDQQKRHSEQGMAFADNAIPEWRALLNEYRLAEVAALARSGLTPEMARAILEAKHGRAL